MDRQAELRQLYEVKNKLKEIEALENAIKKKQGEIESKKNYLRGLSSYDTKHAARAEENHNTRIDKIRNRIRNANIIKLLLLGIVMLIPYLKIGKEVVDILQKFLSENEYTFANITFEPNSTLTVVALLSPLFLLYIILIIVLSTVYAFKNC